MGFKIKKEHLCTLAQVLYHFMFLGSAYGVGNYYIEEFEKTRKVIIEQVDRIERVADDTKKTGDRLSLSLDRVRRVCKI